MKRASCQQLPEDKLRSRIHFGGFIQTVGFAIVLGYPSEQNGLAQLPFARDDPFSRIAPTIDRA